MIRAATAADLPALAEGIASQPLMQRYKRTAEGLAKTFGDALAGGEPLFVWDAGKGPEAVLWYYPEGTLGLGGYLRLIATVSGATRGGIGSKLLAAFEEAVARKSAHAFLLVSDFNTDAHRFYEKHGYTKVGALPKLVRPDIDELIYWKRLR